VKIGCMHLTIISRTKNFGSISVERDPTTPRDQYLSSCRLLYFGISKMANPLVYEDKYFDIPLD